MGCDGRCYDENSEYFGFDDCHICPGRDSGESSEYIRTHSSPPPVKTKGEAKMENSRYKFRAWDGNKMHYPSSCEIGISGVNGKTCIAFQSNGGYITTAYIMQFTGLYDRNGKEIYEGDIVNGGCYNGSFAYGKVVFENGKFISLPIGKFMEFYDDRLSKMEIIGNIYQNPELLGGQNEVG